MSVKPVVVIGAGLSGLCCARVMLQHEVNCVILEASDDIGGRVRTDNVDGFLLDRGFQVLQTVNNLCVVSNVAKSYAPAGQSLVSVSVVGKTEPQSVDGEKSVRRQLRKWYGAQVDLWSLLKCYHIPFALPFQPAHLWDGVAFPARLAEGVYHCGDYAETGSIQGAMISGRKTGEAVIADFAVSI